MTNRISTVAIALTLTSGALAPAVAEPTLGFSIPAVIGGAYHQPGVAVNAAEVRHHGGLLVPAATRWVRTRDKTVSDVTFKAPAVVTIAYRDPRVATNSTEVRRQSGFATPSAVHWLPVAQPAVEANAGHVRLGSL